MRSVFRGPAHKLAARMRINNCTHGHNYSAQATSHAPATARTPRVCTLVPFILSVVVCCPAWIRVHVYCKGKIDGISHVTLTSFCTVSLVSLADRAPHWEFNAPAVSLSVCQSVSLSVCQSVSLCQSVSVCVSLCQSVSVCVSLCQSVSVCVSLCQSVSVCVSLCQSVSVCVSLCQSVSVCVSLCQSVSVSVCVSLCQSVSVCVSLCQSVSVCVSLCQSVSLSVCQSSLSVCQSVSLSVCQSVSLSIYIYHTSVIFGPAAPALRANVSRLI